MGFPKILKRDRGFVDFGGKSHDVDKIVYEQGGKKHITYSNTYHWDKTVIPDDVDLKLFNAPKDLRRKGVKRIF